jgi:hypothetical protein
MDRPKTGWMRIRRSPNGQNCELDHWPHGVASDRVDEPFYVCYLYTIGGDWNAVSHTYAASNGVHASFKCHIPACLTRACAWRKRASVVAGTHRAAGTNGYLRDN